MRMPMLPLPALSMYSRAGTIYPYPLLNSNVATRAPCFHHLIAALIATCTCDLVTTWQEDNWDLILFADDTSPVAIQFFRRLLWFTEPREWIHIGLFERPSLSICYLQSISWRGNQWIWSRRCLQSSKFFFKLLNTVFVTLTIYFYFPSERLLSSANIDLGYFFGSTFFLSQWNSFFLGLYFLFPLHLKILFSSSV